MAIPSSMTDLSTTATSNSPAGSDLPSTVDDVLRAVQAIVRTEYDTQQTANATYAAASTLTTHTSATSGAHGISAFGATLVDDADAATARATLGLGTAATTASTAYESSGAVSTHAALTATHGVSGALVGTSDAQPLTNKTIVAANNTVTTAASGSLTATELNAALAQLETLIAGIGSVSVQTGYAEATSLSSSTGEDAKYTDITITAVSAVANCEVHFVGGGVNSGSSPNATTIDGGSNIVSAITARLTSTTNLRLSSNNNTMSRIVGRWQVIDHGA